MPAKSRRKRGKNLPPKIKNKDRVNTEPSSSIQESSQDTELLTASETTVTTEKTAPSPPKAQAVRYPYITRELWTIGALGVLMIIILIILGASM
jgi:hypothetical protein